MGNAIQNQGNLKSVSQLTQQSSQAAKKEGMDQVKQLVQDIVNDAKELSDNLAGRIAVKDPNKSTKENNIRDMKNMSKADATQEAQAMLSNDVDSPEDIEKKKKKKKDFDKKLKGLATILEQIDTSELEEKEKKEIETFQKNLKQLNYLQRQLDLLDSEEEHLQQILDSNSK